MIAKHERAEPIHWATVAGLALLQALLLLLIATALIPSQVNWHRLDLGIYANASQRLLRGELPYRDFGLEYPPFALVPFVLPRLLTFGQPLEGDAYYGVFALTNLLYSTLAALGLTALVARWRSARSVPATLLVYALLVGLLAPLLPWRYDMFPALLTLFALLAALDRRPLVAGVLLGLGVAAKLYPLVLIALFVVAYFAYGNRRALLRLLAGSAVAVLVTLLPFLVLAPRNVLSFLSYHQARGLQIESGAGGLISLLGSLGLLKVEPSFNYGAFHLASPLSGIALRLLTPAFVVALGLVLWACFRSFRADAERDVEFAPPQLASYVVAVLLVFMITNKVFSPQYVIWLLPFVPLLPARQAQMLGLIFVLTIALFPFLYDRLLSLQPGPVLLLNLRNALVVALIPWLLARAPLRGSTTAYISPHDPNQDVKTAKPL